MAKIQIKASPLPGLPDVSLNIGGRERQLAYDFAAIVKAEELTGINLMRAATFRDLSFSQVRGLLYAALLKDDPELAPEDLNDWPILYNLVVIQSAVAAAWFGAVPEAKEDEPVGEEKAQTKEV